jgi:hypothetical protein
MITREHIKQWMVEVVIEKQGCKATELAAVPEIAMEIAHLTSPNTFSELLAELVKEGWLVEVEYTIPRFNFRVKSFLLPGGSEVRF